MTKSEDTKEKIMQATIQVAAENGLANTRTSEIAKVAGVSEGLIFKYFPTKAALFGLVVDLVVKRLKAGVVKIIKTEQLSATEKLHQLIDFHFQFFMNEMNLAEVLFSHSDKKSLGFHVETIIEHGLIPYAELIVEILNEGIRSGEFRSLNPQVMAAAMIGCMQVTLANRIVARQVIDLEIAKVELTNFILAGIKAESGGGGVEKSNR